jgi:PAS domain S-box-containing protein
MAMDITELKLNEQRLVASEEAYRSILENAVDAIFLCDMTGRIKDANRRASELLGYTKDELCEMTAEDLHPQDEHERLHEVFRQLANCGTTLVVHPVLRKDRQVIYCEVAATLIR